MSDITSVNSHIHAGRAMMNARINSALSSGQISSTDESAFATALDSIDSSLSSSSGSSSTTTGSVGDRISSLIDNQVTSGTLTTDQASELKSLFHPGGGRHRSEGTGTQDDMTIGGMMPPPGGPGAPPAATSSSSDTSSDSSSSDSSGTTSATTTASSTDDQLTQLIDLLEKLRGSLTSSATTYGGNTTSGLVLNTLA